MLYIQNNDVRLNYIFRKNNDTPALVLFVPGAVNTCQEIDAILQQSNASFNYAAISIRGRGESDSPEMGYTLDDQSGDLICLFNELSKEYTITIFGHSIGSSIAINALSKLNHDKINALIMGDFAPFYPPFDKNWADWITGKKVQTISSTALNGIVADAKYIDVSENLTNLQFPLYLFAGNTQFSALRDNEKEALKKICPNITIVDINAGHELLFENPVETIQAISKIL